MSVKGLRPPDCPAQVHCNPATEAQVAFFYFSIYVVAVGCGGIIPCLSPFGANQFNEEDDKERRMKRSFFNYWGIAIAGGGAIAVTGRWLAVMNLTESISRLIFFSFSKVHIFFQRWNCIPIVWRKDSEEADHAIVVFRSTRLCAGPCVLGMGLRSSGLRPCPCDCRVPLRHNKIPKPTARWQPLDTNCPGFHSHNLE